MNELMRGILAELFAEAYEGASKPYTWFVDNKPNAGILGTLAALTAAEASYKQPSGSSIAAHSEHLRWSLALANAYMRGEQPTPKWADSWTLQTVDEAAWLALQEALKAEFAQFYRALTTLPNDLDAMTLTGAVAALPHAAYHLGAIRQMACRAP